MTEQKTPEQRTPLDDLPFPVQCCYPGCGEILDTADAVDEHITENHLPEAIWNFADDNMWEVEATEGL